MSKRDWTKVNEVEIELKTRETELTDMLTELKKLGMDNTRPYRELVDKLGVVYAGLGLIELARSGQI